MKISNVRYKATTDKKRREIVFEEGDILMDILEKKKNFCWIL